MPPPPRAPVCRVAPQGPSLLGPVSLLPAGQPRDAAGRRRSRGEQQRWLWSPLALSRRLCPSPIQEAPDSSDGTSNQGFLFISVA